MCGTDAGFGGSDGVPGAAGQSSPPSTNSKLWLASSLRSAAVWIVLGGVCTFEDLCWPLTVQDDDVDVETDLFA